MPMGLQSGSQPTAVCRAGARGAPAVTEEERALVQAAQLAEELAEHPAATAVVIGEELRLRRELGPPLGPDELVCRFQQWRAELPALLGPASAAPAPPGPLFPSCGEVFAECLLLAELGRGA